MHHLNYNHLYYFWMVCKQGSVVKAAEALFLAPQTVTGQIKAFESRLNGKLLKPSGRSVEPTELGQLVFQYADKMFDLSYEMLDIVNYSQQHNLLFDVGVADALSKHFVSQILTTIVPQDQAIHLRCFESTHEMLLEQLSTHKLDMILSDGPIGTSLEMDLYSKKLGECSMSLFSYQAFNGSLLEALKSKKFLIPGRRTHMGRLVNQWLDYQGIQVDILGEFDDTALMKAFARYHPEVVFFAPSAYAHEFLQKDMIYEIGQIDELKEEYFVIFAQRMIQHPAVKKVCEADFSFLFKT